MTATAVLGFSKAEASTGIPSLGLIHEPRPAFWAVPVKASSNSIVFIGEPWVDSDWIIAQNTAASIPEITSYESMVQSTKPAFVSDEDAKKRSPLKYRVTFNTNETAATSTMSNFVFENTKILVQTLADAYSTGKIEIPEIVQVLGEPWNESMVVLLLEILKAHRPVSVGQLSSQEEEKVLRKLAEIRGTPEAEKFNETDWIKREVIASQRIESVYVLLDNFPTTS